jgi:hypothetical protein
MYNLKAKIKIFYFMLLLFAAAIFYASISYNSNIYLEFDNLRPTISDQLMTDYFSISKAKLEYEIPEQYQKLEEFAKWYRAKCNEYTPV